jgi:hypothetical protein
MPVVGFLDSASLEAFADGVTGVSFHHRRKSRCRSIKRQEWCKSSNPRQAAPCSVSYNLSVCKGGITISVSARAACGGCRSKMVGLGEERNEVLRVMDDLRAADVDFLTSHTRSHQAFPVHAEHRFCHWRR